MVEDDRRLGLTVVTAAANNASLLKGGQIQSALQPKDLRTVISRTKAALAIAQDAVWGGIDRPKWIQRIGERQAPPRECFIGRPAAAASRTQPCGKKDGWSRESAS